MYLNKLQQLLLVITAMSSSISPFCEQILDANVFLILRKQIIQHLDSYAAVIVKSQGLQKQNAIHSY